MPQTDSQKRAYYRARSRVPTMLREELHDLWVDMIHRARLDVDEHYQDRNPPHPLANRADPADELAKLIADAIDSSTPTYRDTPDISEQIADAILAHYRILAR